MVTKKSTDNVIQLRKSSNFEQVNITHTTWKDLLPKANDTYIRDKKLSGFYIRLRTNWKSSYCINARPFGTRVERVPYPRKVGAISR